LVGWFFVTGLVTFFCDSETAGAFLV